jgi:hypothetical protein
MIAPENPSHPGHGCYCCRNCHLRVQRLEKEYLLTQKRLSARQETRLDALNQMAERKREREKERFEETKKEKGELAALVDRTLSS